MNVHQVGILRWAANLSTFIPNYCVKPIEKGVSSSLLEPLKNK